MNKDEFIPRHPLSMFFYILLNEEMPVNKIQRIMARSFEECDTAITNTWLLQYADWMRKKFTEDPYKYKHMCVVMPTMKVIERCQWCKEPAAEGVVSGTGYECTNCGKEL
jgi:hypothetical protein